MSIVYKARKCALNCYTYVFPSLELNHVVPAFPLSCSSIPDKLTSHAFCWHPFALYRRPTSLYPPGGAVENHIITYTKVEMQGRDAETSPWHVQIADLHQTRFLRQKLTYPQRALSSCDLTLHSLGTLE